MHRLRAFNRTILIVLGVTASVALAVFPLTTTISARAATSAPVKAAAAPGAQRGAYDFVASDGGVFTFGGAGFYGSTGGVHLVKPIVGMATTPSGHGYWLVASDGGVFAFGDARFHGSTGGINLTKPIVGMAATPSGNGYWLVASDGGLFAFGDARFHGSTGGTHLFKPIVGMAPTGSGNGYWLVASDGGLFAFGDALFHGSTGGIRLDQPIVGMAPTSTGNGYWLVASDGGMFAFGDARFHGSTGGIRLDRPIVGMTPTGTGDGYWLVASDGGIFAFGDAEFSGSMGGYRLAQPIVGMTRAVDVAGAILSPGGGNPPPTPPPAVSNFQATASLPASGGSSDLQWSTTNASGCTLSASPAVAGLPKAVPCSGSTSVTLPANPSPNSQAYTFTLTATAPGAANATANATTTVAGFVAATAPVSTATSETPAKVPAIGVGQQLTVTFDQGVSVAPGYSLTLTDGTNEGVLNGTNSTASLSNGAHTVTFTLTAPPIMQTGSILSGVNLQVLSATGVTDAAGSWNLLQSGEVDFLTNTAPASCTPVNSRVFGGTNCLNFGAVTFGGPDPTSIYDVIARPTYDLPGAAATSTPDRNATILSSTPGTGTTTVTLTGGAALYVGQPVTISGTGVVGLDGASTVATVVSASEFTISTPGTTPTSPAATGGSIVLHYDCLLGSGCDQAPEVITNCSAGSTDSVYDLISGAPLGAEPCGTTWHEDQFGNTTSNTLDYIPTPTLSSFEQVGVVETVPGSLWQGGTSVPPQVVSVHNNGDSTATFTFNTPVTCPGPAKLTGPDDPAWEAAQYFWYTNSGGSFSDHHASSISCPPATGGYQIKATFTGGDALPAGPQQYKFEGFGTSGESGVLLIPTGGTSSPFAGEREASQSFLG